MSSLFKHLFAVISLVVLLSVSAFASESPLCMAQGQPLDVNNEQILDWKMHSKNQYKNRGHLAGVLTRLYKDKTGHRHFQVRFGDDPRATIEIIYNQKFGKMTEQALHQGAEIEACGDYITSNKRAGNYPASPDGAILHWVHGSTNSHHDSGYVIIDGTVFGLKE